MGSIPGQELRAHKPQSNSACVLQLLSPCTASRESMCRKERSPCHKEDPTCHSSDPTQHIINKYFLKRRGSMGLGGITGNQHLPPSPSPHLLTLQGNKCPRRGPRSPVLELRTSCAGSPVTQLDRAGGGTFREQMAPSVSSHAFHAAPWQEMPAGLRPGPLRDRPQSGVTSLCHTKIRARPLSPNPPSSLALTLPCP